MNYRHIYHAGNFADVLKHAVLARLVTYMKGKDKAFRVIDTHAGIGLYDLSSTEAQKTGEWRDGIGRLLRAELDPAAAELLSPYLDAVRALNDGDSLERYPGSPQLTRMLMRKQDRLSAIELHPQDAEALRALFDGDYQTRVLAIDGWLALGAHVPPKEKRGIMLVDPPFEESGEFDRMVDGLARAWRRWPGGTYCLWYPLKDGAPTGQFHNRLEALGIPRIYCAELCVRDAGPGVGLAGSGVIVVNPPYTLEAEMRVVLPELCRILAQEDGAAQRSFWIAGETTVAN